MKLASSFLALLLPTQVTAKKTLASTTSPTSAPTTPPPTNVPTPVPCPAGQIETWAELVTAVEASSGSTNPTLITLCPRTFTVDEGVDLAGKYVDIKCGGAGAECVIDGRGQAGTNTNSAFAEYVGGATFKVSLEGLTFKDFNIRSPAVDISSENGSLAMKECTFTSNSWGAVKISRGTLDIQDCLFESNGSSASAVWVGDGSDNTAVATISNSVFKDNTGSGDGGALRCGGSNVQCYVSNSAFTGNQALTSGTTGEGGAIYCSEATCSISGSTFTGNQATGTPDSGSGGGVWCGFQATCSISASSFLNNDAANGDNIYCTDDSLCNVDLCINESYNGGVSL